MCAGQRSMSSNRNEREITIRHNSKNKVNIELSSFNDTSMPVSSRTCAIKQHLKCPLKKKTSLVRATLMVILIVANLIGLQCRAQHVRDKKSVSRTLLRNVCKLSKSGTKNFHLIRDKRDSVSSVLFDNRFQSRAL